MRRRSLLAAVGSAAAASAAHAAATDPARAPVAQVAHPATPSRTGIGLTLWTMQLSPFHDDYVRGVLKGFEAAFARVRVRWIDVPWAEMERKTLASMAGGTAPDVVNLNPQFAARLAELGALRDPRPYLGAERVQAYLPAAWQANMLSGTPFALPWYLSTTLTVANLALLERAGVAAPPQGAQALLEVSRAVRARTGAYAWLPALDGAAPLELTAALHGQLFADDGLSLSRPAAGAADVFEYLRAFHAERLLPPSVLTEGHRDAVARFASGSVALIGTGMQFLQHIRRSDPALYARVGVAPQFVGAAAGTTGAVPNIAAMNLAVPSSSREPALAFELAAFLTRADHQLALVRRVPLLPSTRASYDDALFASPSGDALLDRARTLSAQQAAQGRVQVAPMRHYHKLRSAFVRTLHEAIVGRLDAAQARARVNGQWRALREGAVR